MAWVFIRSRAVRRARDLSTLESQRSPRAWQGKGGVARARKKHLDAIKEHGITKHHRKTFGICKQFA